MKEKPDTPDTPVRRVIDALGGTGPAAEFFGENINTVCNWVFREKLPVNKYLQQKSALEARGIDAPDSLWFVEKASADA